MSEQSAQSREPSAAATRVNVPLLVVKAAIALGLIGLLWFLNIVNIGDLAALGRAPGLTILALLLIFTTFPMSAFRWWLLLRAQAIDLPFTRIFRITVIGQFFNTFMLGGVGGDAVRFYYLYQLTAGKRAAGAVSLLADRILGFGALLALAGLIIVVDSDVIAASTLLRSFAHAVVVLLGIAAVSAVLMLVAPRRIARRIIDPLQQWGRLGSFVHGCFEALSIYRHRPSALAAGAVLSLLIQMVTITGFLVAAAIFHFPDLVWTDYAFATPLALLANQLPITPGGIGVGESVFAVICRAIAGSGPPYGTIFFAVRLLSAVAALYGAAAWVNYRKSVRSP